MEFNALESAADRLPWPATVPRAAGVTHVELDAQGQCALPPAFEGLAVMWWRGRPVAQQWLDAGEAARGFAADQKVLARIAAEEDAAPLARHSASVVICTRDRPDELGRCLASLPRQTLAPREVIVVDNASRDSRTQEVARSAGAIYVREDRPGLDIARNAGARRASAEIVAYTDDDVLLHPSWLERLVAAFDGPHVAAVTGLVLPAELATDAQRHFERWWSFGRGFERRDVGPAQFHAPRDGATYPAWTIGAGASMAFRRETFSQVGLFDERLDVGQAGCSGDSELWYRVLAAGLTCRYEARAVAFHYHRRTTQGLASQIHHYMRGHAAALMVQWQRTGIAANRRQAFVITPRWYAGRVGRRLRGAGTPHDRFLRQEIAGYLAGLWFFWRHRRGG